MSAPGMSICGRSLCIVALFAYAAAYRAFAAGEDGKPEMSPDATGARHSNDAFSPDPSYES